MTEIHILSAARTAIGGFGGSLSALPPIDIATHAAKAALHRAGVEGARIGQVVMGHVINTEPRDMYLSRVMAMNAGIPETTPAMNVNRLCGSGAQAIVSAVQALMLGDADLALAGGAECMSRSPYILPAARFGQKMGDTRAIDMMTGALTCPFGTGHMGVTAENVAAEYGITRADQDAFALESQTRAARAIARSPVLQIPCLDARGLRGVYQAGRWGRCFRKRRAATVEIQFSFVQTHTRFASMWTMPRSVLRVVAVILAICAVGGFVLGVRGAPERARRLSAPRRAWH